MVLLLTVSPAIFIIPKAHAAPRVLLVLVGKIQTRRVAKGQTGACQPRRHSVPDRAAGRIHSYLFADVRRHEVWKIMPMRSDRREPAQLRPVNFTFDYLLLA